MRNIGTRALALILADAHHAAADRIFYLVDLIDQGKLDADALTFSSSDPADLAEQALDLVKIEPRRPSGPTRAETIKSAKTCPECRARNFRTFQVDGRKSYRCFSCGYIPTGDKVGKKPADQLLSKPCPRCKTGAYRNVTRKIEGRRYQCRICDSCGYASNDTLKRAFAVDIMEKAAERKGASMQEVRP